MHANAESSKPCATPNASSAGDIVGDGPDGSSTRTTGTGGTQSRDPLLDDALSARAACWSRSL